MKKIISLAASVAFLLGMSTVANAQETKVVDPEGGHYFIGIKGGAQATLTHYNFTDLVTPQYGIYFGKYFNQYLGVRLDVTGYQNKGGFKASRYDFIPNDYAYKFNAGTADIDLLFNMTNIINPKRVNRSWNWNLLAGFGMNYTWERDEFNAYVSSLKYYEDLIRECQAASLATAALAHRWSITSARTSQSCSRLTPTTRMTSTTSSSTTKWIGRCRHSSA